MMVDVITEAFARLDELEAERLAAIAMSAQKAEEAKLIGARQEGFRAAMELLTGTTSANNCESQSDKSRRRRPRRDIVQLILREISFSGKAMTRAQIAQGIDYIPERTERALKRLETGGKVIRDEHGRWMIATAAVSNKMTPTAVFESSGPGSPVLNSPKHVARHPGLSSVENTGSTPLEPSQTERDFLVEPARATANVGKIDGDRAPLLRPVPLA
jgi:predicted transcriptional regulator